MVFQPEKRHFPIFRDCQAGKNSLHSTVQKELSMTLSMQLSYSHALKSSLVPPHFLMAGHRKWPVRRGVAGQRAVLGSPTWFFGVRGEAITNPWGSKHPNHPIPPWSVVTSLPKGKQNSAAKGIIYRSTFPDLSWPSWQPNLETKTLNWGWCRKEKSMINLSKHWLVKQSNLLNYPLSFFLAANFSQATIDVSLESRNFGT